MAEGETGILIEVAAAMIIALVALYVAIYFLKRRRRGFGKNRCGICGHSVKFRSDCCHAGIKYKGSAALCSKCKNPCEIACFGCSHKKCQKKCEKCIRYI